MSIVEKKTLSYKCFALKNTKKLKSFSRVTQYWKNLKLSLRIEPKTWGEGRQVEKLRGFEVGEKGQRP